MDWKIFVRQDLVVAKASEFFYEFVGENSFRPVSELLLPEDGELLKKAVEADTFQPLELITVLHNLKDSVRNVYLRLEQSEQTENGIPLYQITVSDIHDLENRNLRLEQSILKYRHFMTLEDVYFFEYLIEQDSITVYKYVNERAMNQFEGPMNALIRNVEQAHEGSDIAILEGQLRTFCAHLRNGDDFFEMEFVSEQEDKGIWRVKGARIPKKRDMVAGIITPDRNREQEAYYLTPAARDAGTGLLNVDGNIRVKSLVCLAELLHDRTYGSGAVQGDRAGNSGGSICAGGVDGDVAVVSDDLLTVVGLDEGDEILSCGVAVELCLLIAYVERSCYNVITGLDVGYGALNAVYVESLYGVVEGAEGDVSDRVNIACYAHHNAVGGVGDLSVAAGHIFLLACFVLLFNAHQLNERASCTGAVLARYYCDVGVKLGSGAVRSGGICCGTVSSGGISGRRACLSSGAAVGGSAGGISGAACKCCYHKQSGCA